MDTLAAHAQTIIDTNRYLTLGTVDPDGQPWTSPVYFAPGGDREFYWLSATDAQHSLNLAERPRVSLVVFDSTVPAYHGRAVYAVGRAAELSGTDLDRALQFYPGSPSRGGSHVEREDVTGAAPYRIYRATASELWVLWPNTSATPTPVSRFACTGTCCPAPTSARGRRSTAACSASQQPLTEQRRNRA
jgi:nitroimidazol reductase NimA-like FMN-containing flavoprotein (pyridoxamine 5'-phosphate oxidase superfamily)